MRKTHPGLVPLMLAVVIVGLTGCFAKPDAGARLPAAADLAACAHLSSLPTAQHGSIEVDLDRVNPSAGRTSVAFALLPRTDQSKPSLGTIVPNPGRHGTSTIDYAGPLYAAGLSTLLEWRGLLLIDPRGVSRSNALAGKSLDRPDPSSATISEQRRMIGAYGVELRDNVGITAKLPSQTTSMRRVLRWGSETSTCSGIPMGPFSWRPMHSVIKITYIQSCSPEPKP